MLHQLRISLIGSEPEIWRSFKVNSAATFKELHGIDKKHPGRAKMLEWLGGGFDPQEQKKSVGSESGESSSENVLKL